MQRRSHECSGQRAACCVPGSAGRHRYSSPLFFIPGHAREVGGIKGTEGLNN